MQLSGESLGESAFNPDNTIWTSAPNRTGVQYTINGDKTYYLTIANWEGPEGNRVPTQASVNENATEYNRLWYDVSPDYLKSGGGYYVYWNGIVWSLTKDEVDHRVKAFPVTTEKRNYTVVSASIVGGVESINYTDTYAFTISESVVNHPYTIYSFDGGTHFWYEGSDHGETPPPYEDWGEDLSSVTKTWSLEGPAGYATLDTQGRLFVTRLPVTGSVTMTLKYTITNGVYSCQDEKEVILLPEVIHAPSISVTNGEVTISSDQHNDLTIYYEMGANEPATPDPTTASQVYDETAKPTIDDDVSCIKTYAVHHTGHSETVVYNIIRFSTRTVSVVSGVTDKTVTVAPFIYSSDVAKPTAMTPYIVSRVTPLDRRVVLTKLDYIPKDVPVLLLDDNQRLGPKTAGFSTTGFTPDITLAAIDLEALNGDDNPANDIPQLSESERAANQLHVADGKMTVDAAQIYMYNQGEFVLTLAGKPKKGRFFLYNPNYQAPANTTDPDNQGGDSRLQLVIDDEPNGISLITDPSPKDNGIWHGLDGRRLSGQPTQKGVYINNGRMVVIK